MRTLRKYNEPYNKGTITPYAGGGNSYFAPPVISNIQVININANDVTITWTTDIPSDSRVRVGLTEEYTSIIVQAESVINHSVTITGLTTATLYHYQVQSKSLNTQLGRSADGTFTTI